MNLSWSELNKNIQTELKKKETFSQGINSLIFLRNEIFTVVENLFSDLSQNDFSLLPFPKSKGNDNATIAWSIFHLFRIEDIVCNSLIKNQQQIFFQNEYDKRLNSKIITTGNEFTNEQMIKFSKELNIKELYDGKIIIGTELAFVYEGKLFDMLGYGIDLEKMKNSEIIKV